MSQGSIDPISALEAILFDACLMAMVEVAYEMQDAADYMVASEENEPGDGNWTAYQRSLETKLYRNRVLETE